MPTLGWLRRPDLPLDAAGRSYIDAPSLDQILDQFINWRGDVYANGHKLIGLTQSAPGNIEVGGEQTGNRAAWIDLIGDDTYTDYGLRIIRNVAGENASSDLIHRGTGALRMMTTEAGPISFHVGASERMRISSAGVVGIGNDGTLPHSSMAVYANLLVGTTTLEGIGCFTLFSKSSDTFPGTIGQIAFANYQVTHADKRIAAINCDTSTAIDTAALVFYTWAAGSVAERLRINNAGIKASGDCDITGVYKVNGVPISAGGGGSQTPWLTDIDAAGKKLLGASGVSVTVAPAGGTSLTLSDATNSTLTVKHTATPVPNVIMFEGGGTSSMVFRLNGTDKVMFNYLGNVGIGTMSPTGRLTVSADANPLVDAATAQLHVTGANTSKRLVLSYSTTHDAALLQSYENGGTVKPILLNYHGGNVGIGAVAAPGYPLTVVGDCNITGAYKINGVPISTGSGGQAQTPWLSDINAGGYKLSNLTQIAVAATPQPGVQFHVRAGADANLWVQAGAYTGATAVSAGNDAGSLNTPLEFRGNPCIFNLGNVGIGTGATTPSNILSVHESQADVINSGVSPVATTWRRGLMVQGLWGALDGGCIQIGSGGTLSWAIKDRILNGPEGLLTFYGYNLATGNMHQVMSLSGTDGGVTVHNSLLVQGNITGNVGNFNVMAYGAKGDGATNDVAAIQAAVDAAVAGGGGVVYFPSRTYLLNGTVLVRGANVNISAYGAIFTNTVGSVNLFMHDQHGGGFSHFKFLGGLFRSSVAAPNGVVAIRCQGDTDGAPCPRMLTIRDVDFENVNYGVVIDKCDDVLVDNIKCYGNTQLYAGSSTDTGAQAYSHRVAFSNIYYYPPGDGSNPVFSASLGGAGYQPAFLTFQRVGGGVISNIQVCSLRNTADGIQLVNDSQGVHMDGLIIQARWGLRFIQTNMGSGVFPPLSNTVNGLDIDMYGVGGIHIGAGVLDTRIKNCGITGYNAGVGPLTEQHGILQDSAGDTLIQGNWFQNIKRGNGILVNTGAHRTFISDNYFADNSMNGSCIHIAAGITNCYVSANFRSSLDASAIFINNLAGAGATVTNNYPTQAVVVEDPEGE